MLPLTSRTPGINTQKQLGHEETGEHIVEQLGHKIATILKQCPGAISGESTPMADGANATASVYG